MEKQNNDPKAWRKYFIYAGVVAGCLISAWYLYRLHLQKSAVGAVVRTDPVWAQFFNVTLIFIASIFQCSLLHKLFVLIMRLFGRERR